MSEADDSSADEASMADHRDVIGGLRRLSGDDGDEAGDNDTALQPTVDNALAPIHRALSLPDNHNTNVNINNPADCPLNIADTVNNNIDKLNIVHKHRVNNYKTVNKNTIYNTFKAPSTTCSTAGETDSFSSCDETEERVNVSREAEFLAVLNALHTKGRVILSSPPGPKRESYVSALRQHFHSNNYKVFFYTSVKDWGKKRSRNENNKQVVLFDCAFGVARLDLEQYHSFYRHSMYKIKSDSTKIVFMVYPHIMSELEVQDRISLRPLLKNVQVVTLLQQPPLSFKHYHGLFLRMLRDTSHGEAIGSLFALAIINRLRSQADSSEDVRSLPEFGFREFSPASLREYATLLTGFLSAENGNQFTDRVLYEAACISLSSTGYLRNEHLLRTADMKFLVQYVRTTDTAENINNKPMVTLQPRDNRGLMGRLYESLTVTGPLFEVFQHPCLYDPQFLQEFKAFCSENDSQRVFKSVPGSQDPQPYWQPLVNFADGQFHLPLFYWSVFGPTSCLCDWLLTFVLQALEYSQILSTAFAFALKGIASPVFMQKEIEFMKRLKGLTVQLSPSDRIPLLKVPTINADAVLTENLRCVFLNIMETAQKPFHYMNKLRIPDTLLHASVDDNVVSIHLPCQQPYLVLRLLTDTDVDEQDEDGNTVLHLAADLGQFDAIKLAVNSGASIAVKNKAGLTPPQLAALRNRDNVQRDSKAWLDLCKACKSGDTNKVKTLLCYYDNHDMLIGEIDMENRTPLHYASSRGQTEVVSLLINLQADVNARDHLKQTPLVLACNRKHLETAKLLISRGADIKIQDINGFSPMHFACMNEQRELVEFLLQHKADVNAKDVLNQTPLNLACNRKHLETAKLLISRGADINIQDIKGFSPLYFACMNGQRELVEFLLQHNADVSLRCDSVQTPLAVACKKGDWDIAELLLQFHADINVSLSKDCVFTLLHEACCEGQYQLAEFVLQHEADSNLETSQGLKYRPSRYDVTPTQRRSSQLESFPPYSTSQPNISYLEGYSLNDVSLRQKKSQPNSFEPISTTLPNSFQPISAQTSSTAQPKTTPSNSAPPNSFQPNSTQPISVSTPNQTSPEPRYKDAPIHLACYKGHASIVQLLVNHGASVNAQREDGATALHVACQTGNIDVVRALISCNADLNLKNSCCESPLLTACLAGKTEVVRLLLQQQVVQLHLNEPDQFGLSPLHCACIGLDRNHVDTAKLLISRGADVNITTIKGFSPLYVACMNGQRELVEFLLQHNADVSLRSDNGRTCLAVACKNGYLDIAELLLQYHADINVSLSEDYVFTLLHEACCEGQYQLAEFVLQHEADPNLETSQGLKYRPSRYDVSLTRKMSSQPNSIPTNSTSQPNSSQPNSAQPNSTTQPNRFQPNSFQPNSTPSNSIQPISVSTPNQTLPEPRYKDAPIHLACYKGHARIVLLLVSHGASVNAQREDGATALHVACQTGDTDVVRALLSCEALLYLKNSCKHLPLFTAVSFRKTEVVRLLLQQRDVQLHVNDPVWLGLSPLHYACIIGDKDIVEVLVEKGAKVNSVCTRGMTPLHWVCVKNQDGVAKILLNKGADLSVMDNCGRTPLQVACKNGHTELVTLLNETAFEKA